MENRTPEEELEYRRYLRRRIRMRKRKRQVMIARAVVVAVFLLVIGLIGFGVGKLARTISGDSEEVAATAAPEPTIQVEIPDGYETVYQEIAAMEEDYPEVADILLNIAQYPLEVLQMLPKNAETLDFVSDYLRYVDDGGTQGGITEEELAETVPLFLQWDQRWGYVKYGDNVLAVTGCGPTCMSMVYTGLTKQDDKTPADMAEFCIDNDYYTSDSGTSWTFMLDGAVNLGLNAEKITVSKDTLQEKIKAGNPVICSMGPGDFTDTGHFIVVRGITDEGNLLINDPNSQKRSETEWDFDQVLEQIKAAWAYSLAQ
ncbi:MAG: C39 family peptidase [Clostridiaceae bacterium]|nr:C39 family peptidase [Clostridiaceae bacterium]